MESAVVPEPAGAGRWAHHTEGPCRPCLPVTDIFVVPGITPGLSTHKASILPELSLQPPLSFKIKHLTLLGHTHAAHSSVLSGAIRSHPPEFWEAGVVETQFQGQAE